MKRENPDISLSQKTTLNSKNNQTNNQPSLSEIRIDNSEKTDEIFERLGLPNQNNQTIQNNPNIQNNQNTQNNLTSKITETINFEAIQSLEKNSKEKDNEPKNEEKSNKKSKNKT